MIVDITRYGNNGEGIALNNGKVTFVKDALMGEKVDINITKQTDRYDVAEVKNVINSSQNRVTPMCPYFGVCGGCQLQHANYEEQLRIKRAKINGNLKKYANFAARNITQTTWHKHLTLLRIFTPRHFPADYASSVPRRPRTWPTAASPSTRARGTNSPTKTGWRTSAST